MNPLKHVAIIMDGNGRWGIKHKKSRNLGHKEGLNTVEKIIKSTIKNKVKYLTLYAFSTENWKRPQSEINFLFKLLDSFIEHKINEFKNSPTGQVIEQLQERKQLIEQVTKSPTLTIPVSK